MSDTIKVKAKRGFAAMSPEKRAELSARGGKASWNKGVAHKFSHDEAVNAGHKGGTITQTNRKLNAENTIVE